jgi:hypothetical protein
VYSLFVLPALYARFAERAVRGHRRPASHPPSTSTPTPTPAAV